MRCIIVEDEYPSREELKYFIKTYSCIEILEEFDEALSALKFLENNRVEVVFLDINMPNLDGMSFSKIISKFEEKPKIVFITAYKEYAVEAFEVHAFDYILKPYAEERIIDALKKLEDEDEVTNKTYQCHKITLCKNEKMIVMDWMDIYCCEADERETIVYTKDEKYIAKMNISQFFEKLPQDKFFRSHRSYILNLDKIEEIIPWFNNTYNVQLEDIDVQVPVSRKNIKTFRKIMGI
ncbi:LytR/AlgR family response regulator transcription factor [Marinisporobacter balticus]|uniref:Stage 0 sporulation protein A homolog n=1 Tax=Marinisporobacter balticus TaxID=2018667 RepID=A0A4R2KUG5_9FIRM|nr:LytTR family DNA-binding domain-containing protein [Marinisporobacter balticus]TCO77453.1 LytTR family two component transcriptional regulator [Marinisporobacter balticus]